MKASKFNIIAILQRWIDSVPGQTFLHYAYNWGASIVILGTLFKITHMKGADFMLFLGMGTEVFVFFISAFDRPFDKTDKKHELIGTRQLEKELEQMEEGIYPNDASLQTAEQPLQPDASQSAAAQPSLQQTATQAAMGMAQLQNAAIAAQANAASPAMAEATDAYVQQLQALTHILTQVAEQAEKLTTNSVEMENLNRTLTGINSIYELQLKGVSQQIGTIDQVNEQTRKMAQQIEELNGVYGRMINALTVNMRNAAGNAPQQ